MVNEIAAQQFSRILDVLVLQRNPETGGAWRDTIESLPNLRVRRTASDIREGTPLSCPFCPDLIVTDTEMDGASCIGLIGEWAQCAPRCRILVVSDVVDGQTLFRCIRAGASGYILKDASSAEMARSLLEVLKGGTPISPLIARFIVERFRQEQGDGRAAAIPELTNRELAVLKLMATGYSNKLIVQHLSISPATVQSHTKNIFRKLMVNSRAQAIYQAHLKGLISFPPHNRA